PQVSGAAEPSGLPLTKPIEASVGSVPNGEAATPGGAQTCSGTRPTPEDMAPIVVSSWPAEAAWPVARSCSARSADSTGQMCPVPWLDGAHGLPSSGQV